MPPGDTPITAEKGWSTLTHSLGLKVPRALAQSVQARRGIRALIRQGR